MDVETAHNANLPCCGAVWGFRTREELNAAGAEYLAENSDGRYCINGWCYLQVCRAFGLKVSEEEATAARLRSRRAYLLTWSVVGNDEETADSEDAITDADFM